jgi:hypothetical protein
MRNADTILPNVNGAIRWAARIIGLLLILFVATIYLGEGRELKFDGLKQSESAMMVSLLGALAGLLVGWIWEGLGGLLTILGLFTFSIIGYYTEGNILFNIWILGIPAILFIIYWWRTN